MESKKFDVDGNAYECNVDAIMLPTIERMLRGTTKSDEEINQLEIPKRPIWLNISVRSIRLYRKYLSPKLGNRCVFEPSCSHYAELALRNKGCLTGSLLTLKRLARCKPGNGGIDFP